MEEQKNNITQNSSFGIENNPGTKELSLYKKLVIVFGLVVILVAIFFIFGKSFHSEDKGLFEDRLTPAERKIRVLDRVTGAVKIPLDDKEAHYIFNYLSSAEGKAIELSEEDKLKLINSLNQ